MAEIWEGLGVLDPPARKVQPPQNEWWQGLGVLDEQSAQGAAPDPFAPPAIEAPPLPQVQPPADPTYGGEYVASTPRFEQPELSLPERMLAEQEARKAQGIDPYQYNLQRSAEFENEGRDVVTGSLPYRTAETALEGAYNKVTSLYGGALSTAADAVGLDGAGAEMELLRDVAQGNLAQQGVGQAQLDKRGLLGETLTGWLRQGGAAVGESIGAGAVGGLPGLATYFGLSSYDQALHDTGSQSEALSHGLIEGAFTFLGGKILGAGTGKLAQKLGGATAGKTLGGETAAYLAKKFPIPKWGAEAIGGTGGEIVEEASTEAAHYLTDVAFGRETWSPEKFVERVKGVVGPSLVAGGLGGALSAKVDTWAKQTASALDARQKELPDATTTQETPVQRAPEQVAPETTPPQTPQPAPQPTSQRPVFDPTVAESWTSANPDVAKAVASRVAGGQKLTRGDLEKLGVPNAGGSSTEQRAEFGQRVKSILRGEEIPPPPVVEPIPPPVPLEPEATNKVAVDNARGDSQAPESAPGDQPNQAQQPLIPQITEGQKYIGTASEPGRYRGGVYERGKSRPYPEQEQPMVATEQVRTRKQDKMFGGDVTERMVITGTGRAMWVDERNLQPLETTESEATPHVKGTLETQEGKEEAPAEAPAETAEGLLEEAAQPTTAPTLPEPRWKASFDRADPSRKSDILRHIGDTSQSNEDLAAAIGLARGLPDESHVLYAVSQNKAASKEVRERAAKEYEAFWSRPTSRPSIYKQINREAIPQELEVEVQTIQGRSGERTPTRRNAKQTVTELEESATVYRNLLNCLKS